MSAHNKRSFNKFHKRNKFDFKSNRQRFRSNVNRQKAPQLEERDVGITEYLNNLEGFSGVIKARYSDFQVNEIDLNGVEAKLTDVSVPEDFRTEESDAEVERPVLISEEVWNNLEKIASDTENGEPINLDVTALNKDERLLIHNTVKQKFGKKIVTNTIQQGTEKLIQFKKYDKTVREDHRKKWPTSCGEYVHFIVYKESVDTITACYKISDCLRMKPSHFTYAGVKDKRAKTTQWFSVRKVFPDDLLKKTNRLQNIKIGNITFKDEPLKLGQLKGNRFRVGLRNVTASDELIESSMKALKEKGFINYYGLQRFGNDREVPTHLIGLKLLQGNFKEACNLILKLKISDEPFSDTLAAKKLFDETRDAKKAFELFKRNKHHCVESKLLEGLAKNGPNDYVNSLENIPRNMRLLYIHAFQSLIWNKIVSRRIREFGLQPIEGDLVDESESKDSADVLYNADNGNEVDMCSKAVKVLTKSDLESYSIFDVVLPLPGYDVCYPENEVKLWYKEALEEYGLTLEMTKQKVKSYNLSGTYRKICAQVENCKWYTILYNDPNYNIIRSDWEEFQKEEEPISIPDGKYKALIVDFALNSACYATMALREILKTDTSTNAQASLNDYHKVPKVQEKDEISFANPTSLLNNPEKLAAFKSIIFDESVCTKRKLEDENENDENLTSARNEEVEAKRTKIESSLV